MQYKDIQHKYGIKFGFEEDVLAEKDIPYMVICPSGYVNYFSAIVNLYNGKITAFGEYDDILKEPVIEIYIGILNEPVIDI